MSIKWSDDNIRIFYSKMFTYVVDVSNLISMNIEWFKGSKFQHGNLLIVKPFFKWSMWLIMLLISCFLTTHIIPSSKNIVENFPEKTLVMVVTKVNFINYKIILFWECVKLEVPLHGWLFKTIEFFFEFANNFYFFSYIEHLGLTM